ncbi:MAG: TonB-dependent receptor, partial [Gammaproteobacteria bacterium]|nr:TonB-dependent receptor [Gammaproteobacteria bacterium]
MNTLRTILASLLVAPGFPVLAEPVDTAPVVVTASRLAETQDETLASVSVITREEIERIQPHSVVELLRLQAGVDVARNGGLGGNTSVFLRGANSDHTLVLIDGVRVSSATTGTFAWQHLDPAQIERIEIVRGPRASLYGSDALGGVIQIFTRRPAGATGRVGLGTHGTVRADAGFGGGRPAGLRYSGQASLIDSSGFDATQPGTFGHDPDDDGYRDESLNARIEAPLGETASLAVQGWHSNGLVEFDQGTQDTENEQAQLTLEQAPTAFWSQRLSAGYAGDIVITDSPFPSDIRTRRRSAEWQHDLSFGAGQILTLGVDYHEDEGRNVDLATGTRVFDRSIESSGAFAGYRAGFGRYDVQLAAREDDHSEFGGARTGSLALGVEAGALRLVASHGTAFKAPTLNQLFHPGFGGF